MSNWVRCAIGVVLIVAASACSGKGSNGTDPKEVLSDYIGQTFSAQSPSDRAKLLSSLTSEAKSRLEAWSDEQFRQAFIEKKRKFVKLTYLEVKGRGDRETSITYELTYRDTQKESEVKVTQRKLARLTRNSSASNTPWKIAEVRNIRELIEFENAMSLP